MQFLEDLELAIEIMQLGNNKEITKMHPHLRTEKIDATEFTIHDE